MIQVTAEYLEGSRNVKTVFISSVTQMSNEQHVRDDHVRSFGLVLERITSCLHNSESVTVAFERSTCRDAIIVGRRNRCIIEQAKTSRRVQSIANPELTQSRPAMFRLALVCSGIL